VIVDDNSHVLAKHELLPFGRQSHVPKSKQYHFRTDKSVQTSEQCVNVCVNYVNYVFVYYVTFVFSITVL